MNRTKIEWVKNPDGTQGFTWNPIKGLCPMGCSYCYARKMYKRFKWDPTIRLDRKELDAPLCLKTSSTIFAGSMFELFWGGFSSRRMDAIFNVVQETQQHTYLFLSKNPWRYSELFLFDPFSPKNCWLGASVTSGDDKDRQRLNYLRVLNPNLKPKRFVSFEPLLGDPLHGVDDDLLGIDWVIIGAQTQPERQPEEEWVQKILEVASKTGTPVFMKDNLKWPIKIQQFPKGLGPKV